ncbi:hypothetical protein [Gloeocapsopsis dulcis]|nr:hypothetical protein [Gloeocapsopsis dulcis]WNN87523.1 hypothetical protein P0S91_14440 [Gloeocapsopsis dulcis]
MQSSVTKTFRKQRQLPTSMQEQAAKAYNQPLARSSLPQQSTIQKS